jgi:hypothetical protein
MALGDLGKHPVCDPAPELGVQGFCCVGCWAIYHQEDVLVTDNGPACFNCLKALADSYFDD